MSQEDPQHTTNGLMRWLADQFSAIQWKLGELHANQLSYRQMAIDMHRTATHRMDRIEDRLANGHKKLGWLRHVPWFKISLLLVMALLVITGHLTVSEIKAYLAKRLLD